MCCLAFFLSFEGRTVAQHNLDDPSMKNGGLNKTVRQFNSCVKCVSFGIRLCFHYDYTVSTL